MISRIKTLLFILLAGMTACQPAPPTGYDAFSYQATKQIEVQNAAAVSAHPLASEVGKAILLKGGNAVDAAVAMQFVLAVVYPNAGNIGGGGFMVIYRADGTATTFDYREKAPALANRDMFLDAQGNAIEALSRDGHLAVGVPGTVAGLFDAHEKYGALPMSELIQPAIDLAATGFSITEQQAASLNSYREDILMFSTMPMAFVREREWVAGDSLLQPELARTLERIRDFGKAGFYEGETASLIVAEMQRGKGIVSLDDLAGYQAVEREPVSFDYKDHRVVTMGLPSSGGIMLQQMLGTLEDYPIESYTHNSPEAVQLMVEIERRSFADRSEYMGDPDFVDVPVSRLVDPIYLRSRMTDYHPRQASASSAINPGIVRGEKEETTHLCVVDEQGNAVSVTTTLNGNYGSRVVVGGAGFFLNNQMDDFSAAPGTPNSYGLLGNEANQIDPRKRMVSSMTPTIVLKDNKPFLVLGTPGGSTIITSVFQTLVNLLDFNLGVEDAVNKPKFHHQWLPDTVYVEAGFPGSTIRSLESMGYAFKERKPIGRTEVIKINPFSIIAVGDGRGNDSAAGY